MYTDTDQWEQIFRRDGRIFLEPAKFITQWTGLLKERGVESILDIGCGTGRHLVHMSKFGFHSVGLDNSPTALLLAREWLLKEGLEADLLISDMRLPLPFKNDSFGAVISTQVIHHARLATVLNTAKEIERVVCTGGMIAISVPARRTITEGIPGYEEIEPNTFVPMSGSEKGLPHHLFTPDEFREIFPRFKTLDLQVIDDRVIALTGCKI